MGGGLGIELRGNNLLYTILGLPDESNHVSFQVRCCVLGLEIYCFARVCTRVGGSYSKNRRGI